MNKWFIILLITIITLLIIMMYFMRNHEYYTTTSNSQASGYARDFINMITPSTYKSIKISFPHISKAWKEQYVVNDEKSMDEYAKKKLTANDYAKFKRMSPSGKHIYLSHL